MGAFCGQFYYIFVEFRITDGKAIQNEYIIHASGRSAFRILTSEQRNWQLSLNEHSPTHPSESNHYFVLTFD